MHKGKESRILSNGPIAIGGIGGSGTRVVAKIVNELGYFIGNELGPALDNLWFALLFGRRSILLTPDAEFDRLSKLFFRQMSQPQPLSDAEIELLGALAGQSRNQHPTGAMAQWASSFEAYGRSGVLHEKWAWKVPYTHTVIDRLFRVEPSLRYVHITRNPYDIAFGRNMNQLKTWGPVFLNHNVKPEPRDALSFWCAVHKRMVGLKEQFPHRIWLLDYDLLLRDPHPALSGLTDFIGEHVSGQAISGLAMEIETPARSARDLAAEHEDFRDSDVEYVTGLGYDRR